MHEKESERVKNYKQMVSIYYSVITDLYRKFWGDDFHPAIWGKGQSRATALENTNMFYLEDANLTKDKRAIDLGCGIGTFSIFVAKNIGCPVLGINMNDYQLEKANAIKRGLDVRNVEFEKFDIMELEKLKQTFDAAFLIDVGCHLPNKKKAIGKVSKILNKKGRLIIVDWMRRNKVNRFEKEILLEPFNKYWNFTYLESMSGYTRLLNKENFEIVKEQDLSQLVKRSWDYFYYVALEIIRDMSVLKLLSYVLNKEILRHRKVAKKIIANQLYANLFAKICSDEGVFRYGYIVAEKR